MTERYLDRNVRKESEEHYTRGWPLPSDARRNLYLKYARPYSEFRGATPEDDDQSPRDIWKEIADSVLARWDDTTGKIGIDVGSSSGYFIEQLLEKGYRGEIIGVDKTQVNKNGLHEDSSYMPFLQDFLNSRFPQSKILLGESDAQSLETLEITLEDNSVLKKDLKDNQFDFLTELFVLYHLPRPYRSLEAAHRVLKPGGLAIFSGRGETNQENLWHLGAITALQHQATQPESFYSHYPLDQMKRDLQESRQFNLIEVNEQEEYLWIPATHEGWTDYRAGLLSLLPLMKSKRTGKQVSGSKVADFLDEIIRPAFFEPQAKKNDGYFVDRVHQAYFVCQAVK
jgi:SAM-dependent methyltransferase